MLKNLVDAFTYHHYSINGHIAGSSAYLNSSEFALNEKRVKKYVRSVRAISDKDVYVCFWNILYLSLIFKLFTSAW